MEKESTVFRKYTQTLLTELEKRKFHSFDVKYGNGYFVFEYGEDSVVHFRLKECKGWLFGIWWRTSTDERYEVEFDFFAQYEDLIDKFKPSRSYFVAEDVKLEDRKDLKDNIYSGGVYSIAEFIKKHPSVSFHFDTIGYKTEVWNEGGYPNQVKAWLDFTKFRLGAKLEKRLLPKYLAKEKHLLELVGKEVCVNPKIHNWGEYSSPRLELMADNFIEAGVDKKGSYDIELDELSPRLRRKIIRAAKKARFWEKRLPLTSLSKLNLSTLGYHLNDGWQPTINVFLYARKSDD